MKLHLEELCEFKLVVSTLIYYYYMSAYLFLLVFILIRQIYLLETEPLFLSLFGSYLIILLIFFNLKDSKIETGSLCPAKY